MNKISKLGTLGIALSMLVGMAFATPGNKTKTKPKACPICSMPLSAKKTKDNPVAVKLGKGPVMYCCAKCKMPANVLVGSKKSSHKKSKTK